MANSIVYAFYTLCLACVWLGRVSSIESCTKKSACSCLSDKGLIDLSPLSVSSGTPRLQAMNGKDVFYFNPCKNFDLKTVTDAGVILHLAEEDKYVACGSNDGARFDVNDDSLTLHLSDTNSRQSIITIKCGQSQGFELTLEFPVKTFHFDLTAPEGCAGYVPPKPTSGPSTSDGLSPGSILLIVFFVVVVGYLVVGVVVQVFVRKETGTQRVPNVHFWGTLPGLIKDGFRFSFSRGRARMTYNSI